MFRATPFLLLAGCAAFGFGEPEPADDEGDPFAPPSLSVLPPLSQDGEAATPAVHQGMLTAREALDRGLPAAPSDRRYPALQAWMEQHVVAWIREHEEKVADIRARVAPNRGASSAERVVGYALEGLIYEHLALELGRMPAPLELESEPDIAEMYGELVDAHAQPFVTSSLLGYRNCADTAHDEVPELSNWARFCARRFERIKAEAAESGAGRDSGGVSRR